MNQPDPLLLPKEASTYTRISESNLAQLRFRGLGPKFLKPTPRTVLYRQSELDAWLERSERTSTAPSVA